MGGRCLSRVGALQGATTPSLFRENRALQRAYGKRVSQRGFTLIELIMVIVLLGAIVALGSVFIISPFEAYEDVRRRAELVEIADQALERMNREVRHALPNSVRVTSAGNRTAVEFLRTVTGGRYRAQPDTGGAGDVLDFAAPDGSFDIIGGLLQAPAAGNWAVVYNLTATGGAANAYVGDNRAAIGAGSTTASVVLSPAFQYPFASPSQRVFIVDAPISYVCDLGSGQLLRYEGYAVTAGQPVTAGDFGGGASALVADSIGQCVFRYDAGASTRHGLLSARLTVTQDGETVSLLQQTHVLNIP